MDSLETIVKKHNSSITTGLSDQAVKAARAQYGPHTIAYQQATWYQILARTLNSSFTYLLCSAAAMSLLLHEPQNTIIITIIIGINAALSFFQEYHAEKSLRILNTAITLQVTVLRNGKKIDLQSIDLVPGDIVYLEPQAIIPTDIRLIESQGLVVDESTLTGESTPVPKDAQGKTQDVTECYLGALIIEGTGQAIVTATGSNTRFGAINKLTVEKKQESNFAKTIKKLSRLFLGITVVSTCLVLAINLYLKGLSDIQTLLMFSIALALSITPEALPLIITIALSRGAAKLADQHVLVKRLSAIEDLGDITVLCADKTGTLTENVLTVTDHYQIDPTYNLFALAGLSSATTPSGFDYAIHNYAQKQNISSNYTIIKEEPFDSKTRSKSTFVRNNTTNKIYYVTKGVIESLLIYDNQTPENTKIIQTWEIEKGILGQRVIGCSIKEISSTDLTNLTPGTLIGLIAFEDPIKQTTTHAVQLAQKLGITIKIISGDGKEVSGAVAYKIGIIDSPDKVITGTEFAALTPAEQENAITHYAVFARIEPEQKYMIVETLKKNNVVGFLGDGINDAPALKAAHVGIVVQGATDLAKSIADIILLKKDLGVIINGIALGRQTFANTIKYIKITLAGNIGNALTLSIASFILPYLPLLPLQILLVNLLTDAPMIAIGTDAVDVHDLRRPSSYNKSDILKTTVIFGIISSLFDAVFFLIFYQLSAAYVQTYWFIENVITDMLFVLCLRTKKAWFTKPYPSAMLSTLLILTSFAGIALPYTHIGQKLFSFAQPHVAPVLFILILSIMYFYASELIKYWYVKFTSQNIR